MYSNNSGGKLGDIDFAADAAGYTRRINNSPSEIVAPNTPLSPAVGNIIRKDSIERYEAFRDHVRKLSGIFNEETSVEFAWSVVAAHFFGPRGLGEKQPGMILQQWDWKVLRWRTYAEDAGRIPHANGLALVQHILRQIDPYFT